MQGSQLLLADSKQLLRVRFKDDSRRSRFCAAESRRPVLPSTNRISTALQPHKRPVPHDHPRHGYQGRKTVVLLRRDGRRHAAARARAGARQPDRLRHERPASGRRGPRPTRRFANADRQANAERAAESFRSSQPSLRRPSANSSDEATKSNVLREARSAGIRAFVIDDANGTLQGATEPRKDGAAVGY